jgi:hypothetical protein
MSDIAEVAKEELVKIDTMRSDMTPPDPSDPLYEAWTTAGILEVLVSPKFSVSTQVAMARAARLLVGFIADRAKS